MTDVDNYDAETIVEQPKVLGGPVDPPDEPRSVYANVVQSQDLPRRPIVPATLRNKDQRRTATRLAAGAVAYHSTYHASRSPKYLAKVLVYSPIGLFRGLWIVAKWLFDLEAEKLRQHAANINKFDEFERMTNIRDRHVSGRSRLVMLLLALLLAIEATAWFTAPTWGFIAAHCLLAIPLAWLGRRKDKPIVDRVVIGEKFLKLTAEMVRGAAVALRIQGLKELGDIEFPQPGIHKDGPGWLARFNLPHGVEAIEVIKRRGNLSSALRLPVDQVWPEVGPEHAGQVDLWVGYLPVSKMPPPVWPLVNAKTPVNVFKGYPVMFDPRLRPLMTSPFERNYLVGGQPGSGKTYAARAIVLGALLDPTVEVWLGAYKASEDFYDVSGYCSRYFCGIDDEAIRLGEEMVSAGLAEVQRRQRLLGKLKREGKITEGRTSHELALQGIGLHPLFLVFDEVHELFLASKEAAEGIIRLVKQGRSAGVICVLATQVASKDSVPTELTRVISSRWCLSVDGQVANDQIMGTGAYKKGLTGSVYRPKVDAGWGVTSGIVDGYQGSGKGYYPTEADLATLLRRIGKVRAGGTFATEVDDSNRRDFLADVRRVFYAGEVFVAWQSIAARLAEEMPQAYADVTKESVSALARGYGIESKDGKERGSAQTLKGLRHEVLLEAISRREIGAGK